MMETDTNNVVKAKLDAIKDELEGVKGFFKGIAEKMKKMGSLVDRCDLATLVSTEYDGSGNKNNIRSKMELHFHKSDWARFCTAIVSYVTIIAIAVAAMMIFKDSSDPTSTPSGKQMCSPGASKY